MSEKTIYIIGYPKSGTTWLTRLMGDILNCPTGGSVPEEDKNEVATEGWDRPNRGKLVVRKGHFRPITATELVPAAHLMDVSHLELGKHFLIHIIRDPRDICVSGAYHWSISVEKFLDRMIAGDIARCGRWDEYTEYWRLTINTQHYHGRPREKIWGDMAHYSRLVDKLDQFDVLYNLVNQMTHCGILSEREKEIAISRINPAIFNQSFDEKKRRIIENNDTLRRNNMRRGVVGEWRTMFTYEMAQKVLDEFWWAMRKYFGMDEI